MRQLPVAVNRRFAAKLGATVVEHRDALPDALQRSAHVGLEPQQHRYRVLVRAAPDVLGLGVGPGDDPAALVLGGLGEPAIVDEEGGLLLCAADDALRFLLRLLDDSLALGIDPLGCPNLLGDGNAQLVDEAEGLVLVEDDIAGEGQLLPIRYERLETLDQKNDVDRGASTCLGRVVRPIMSRAVTPFGWRRAAAHQRGGASSAARSLCSAAGGIISPTSPPNCAISLTRLELT